MSQEIINVLNHLSEQIGIAIDWSSENVWAPGNGYSRTISFV